VYLFRAHSSSSVIRHVPVVRDDCTAVTARACGATDLDEACGLTSPGRILCWGGRASGVRTPPPGNGHVDLDVRSKLCFAELVARWPSW